MNTKQLSREHSFDKHRFGWQLLTLLLVSTAAVYVGIAFDKEAANYIPEYGLDASSFNHKPSGYSGLLELSKNLGINTREWELPYRRLPEIKGTLLIIAPSYALEPFEVKQVLNWVKAGNNLVCLDDFSFKFERRILNEIGIQVVAGKKLADVSIEPGAGQPVFSHVPHLIVSADNRLLGGTALLKDDSGTLLCLIKHGDGQILVGTIASLCSNRRLVESQAWPNFQFLYNFLHTKGGALWFDEICHGYAAGNNVFIFLGRGPAGPVFAQLMLCLLIAVISKSQRFGWTNVVSQKRSISSGEFISGLASTYQRAKATNLAFEILDHAFQSKLCKSLGVGPHEPPESLLAAWTRVTALNPGELSNYLSASAQARQKQKLSPDELMELVLACDKISELFPELLATKKGKSFHGPDS